MHGQLRKMAVTLDQPIRYQLRLDEHRVEMAPLIGQQLQLTFSGEINCIACNRKTRKSFNQGYCWPCSQRLAECDICIVRPEKCHFDQNTCRQPEWGEAHCMQPHIVYLANASGLKVGITRESQLPTRWIDQGASQALPLLRVSSRYGSGLVEILLAQQLSDKTNWRKMLKGTPTPLDLTIERTRLQQELNDEIHETLAKIGAHAEWLNSEQIELEYPVQQHPETVKALNFDKTPDITGQLHGIKGQYLIMDTGVLNIRKFAGYQISINTPEST